MYGITYPDNSLLFGGDYIAGRSLLYGYGSSDENRSYCWYWYK
jgi:hypothetical protein